MKKLEDAMKKFADAMVAFWAVFSVWCVSRITDARTWCQERRRERDERPRRTRINVAVHNNRILPTIVIIIIVLYANKAGVFKEYPGLQAFVNMFLYVMDQFYQFAMKIVNSLVKSFNIPAVWEDFQNWFWKIWIF